VSTTPVLITTLRTALSNEYASYKHDEDDEEEVDEASSVWSFIAFVSWSMEDAGGISGSLHIFFV
jgi:hypothetical protein